MVGQSERAVAAMTTVGGTTLAGAGAWMKETPLVAQQIPQMAFNDVGTRGGEREENRMGCMIK